jgi:hypothetical protein
MSPSLQSQTERWRSSVALSPGQRRQSDGTTRASVRGGRVQMHKGTLQHDGSSKVRNSCSRFRGDKRRSCNNRRRVGQRGTSRQPSRGSNIRSDLGHGGGGTRSDGHSGLRRASWKRRICYGRAARDRLRSSLHSVGGSRFTPPDGSVVSAHPGRCAVSTQCEQGRRGIRLLRAHVVGVESIRGRVGASRQHATPHLGFARSCHRTGGRSGLLSRPRHDVAGYRQLHRPRAVSRSACRGRPGRQPACEASQVR